MWECPVFRQRAVIPLIERGEQPTVEDEEDGGMSSGSFQIAITTVEMSSEVEFLERSGRFSLSLIFKCHVGNHNHQESMIVMVILFLKYTQ